MIFSKEKTGAMATKVSEKGGYYFLNSGSGKLPLDRNPAHGESPE